MKSFIIILSLLVFCQVIHGDKMTRIDQKIQKIEQQLLMDSCEVNPLENDGPSPISIEDHSPRFTRFITDDIYGSAITQPQVKKLPWVIITAVSDALLCTSTYQTWSHYQRTFEAMPDEGHAYYEGRLREDRAFLISAAISSMAIRAIWFIKTSKEKK